MVRVLSILKAVVEEVKNSNPFGLVLKSGTALALHHLTMHRESEDLDFDVPYHHLKDHSRIVSFIKSCFENVRARSIIQSYTVGKEGFATIDRFHLQVTFITHIKMHSKIDLNYKEIRGPLEFEGELGFYSMERMMIEKLNAFVDRKHLKDIFDVYHLQRTVDWDRYMEPEAVIKLIDMALLELEDRTLIEDFKIALRDTDLRFRDLKENGVGSVIDRTIKDLKKSRNILSRKTK
jgi:predicted nucleotidyltransferase component of viral defense system